MKQRKSWIFWLILMSGVYLCFSQPNLFAQINLHHIKNSSTLELVEPKTINEVATTDTVKNTSCAISKSCPQVVLNEPSNVCHPNPCQQFGKFAEPVINKSVDNSNTISNLSNAIYLVTAIILGVTALLILFTVLVPILVVFLQNKQTQAIKEWVTEKTDAISKRNEQLERKIQEMEQKVLDNLRDEFKEELMGDLTRKIAKQMDYYTGLVESHMEQQSGKHEERLYYVEQVHLDLLEQNQPEQATVENLSQWIIRQQEDYFKLLQLISPNETDTFEALRFFGKRERLPDSFLFLLRFLDKQNRIPSESKFTAMKIAQEKFGKSLKPEEE